MEMKGGRPFQVNRNVKDFRDLVHRTWLIWGIGGLSLLGIIIAKVGKGLEIDR